MIDSSTLNSVAFIADLHLSEEDPQKIELFLQFLQGNRFEHLYILGDLFEAWIGDDVIHPAYQPVIECLKETTSNSYPISVMHGNRDFLLGEHFASITGVTLLDDPYRLQQHGRELLLMHGDLLCTDDVAYQQMRKQLRSPFWQEGFLSKPVADRIVMARALREQSQVETGAKRQEIMDVNQQEVISTMQQHKVPLIIHGHTHLPGSHQIDANGKRLGERWIVDQWFSDQGSMILLNSEGQLQATQWQPNRSDASMVKHG